MIALETDDAELARALRAIHAADSQLLLQVGAWIGVTRVDAVSDRFSLALDRPPPSPFRAEGLIRVHADNAAAYHPSAHPLTVPGARALEFGRLAAEPQKEG